MVITISVPVSGLLVLSSHLQALISCRNHFQAQDSDVFLVTNPKSGTTWLKAIIFALVNRQLYPVSDHDHHHPLITHNPHDLVPYLEINLYADNKIPQFDTATATRRLFSTHLPHVSLPESAKCKIVYLCRNPRDTFVSLMHFINKLGPQETGRITNPVDEVFEMFCNGVSVFGPYWDHVLEYWKSSLENPEGIFFLKYEEMKEEAGVVLRRLAEFLGCPFTAVEEGCGVAEEILRMCREGRLSSGVESKVMFRRGEVGDWVNNCLSEEMVLKMDRISEDKFFGSGLGVW